VFEMSGGGLDEPIPIHRDAFTRCHVRVKLDPKRQYTQLSSFAEQTQLGCPRAQTLLAQVSECLVASPPSRCSRPNNTLCMHL
jgi:hypothetical protein